MRNVILGTLAVLICIGSAQAAISLVVTPLQSPDPGLRRYKVTAVEDSSRQITVLSDINVTGCHNVTQAYDPGNVIKDPDWTAAAQAPFGSAAWAIYDTYLLLDDVGEHDNVISQLGGALAETNDNSDPASLGLGQMVGVWYPATVGMGSFGHPVGTASLIVVANAGTCLDFLQVVVPVGQTAYLDIGIVYGPEPLKDEFEDVPIIPEPATMSLLVLGGVALLRRRR